jgi:hypothetical protein
MRGPQLRIAVRLWDKSKVHETSLSDSEDEGTGGRKHRQSYKEGKDRGSSAESKRPRASASASGQQAPAQPPSAVPRHLLDSRTGLPSPNTQPESPLPETMSEAPTSALRPNAPTSQSPGGQTSAPPAVPVVQPSQVSSPVATVSGAIAPAVAIGNAPLASGGLAATGTTHRTQPPPEGGVDVQSWVTQVISSREE